jgi:carbon-monoxide dehydrogenase large subunit
LGEVVGIGIGLYVEPCGQGWESATVSLSADGQIIAATGSTAQGQGRETAIAQIVADTLDVEIESVVVRHGDTNAIGSGTGALASRSTAIGGSAMLQAAEAFREEAREVTAGLLQCAAEHVVPVAGGFLALGGGQDMMSYARLAKTLAEAKDGGRPHPRTAGVSPASYGIGEHPWTAGASPASDGRVERAGGTPAVRGWARQDGTPQLLSTSVTFHTPGEAWSSGCCIACVSIDKETGVTRIDKLVLADDAGRVVNPMLVEGQLIGGMAQGFGEAMMERVVYDEDGQLVTGSLMDYALPRANDVPALELTSLATPSPTNPLGAKGVGEAGCIGIPAAIVNAVVDALSPLGVRHLDMPLTPEKIWRAMRESARSETEDDT